MHVFPTRGLSTAGFVLYPLIAHTATVLESEPLTVASVAVLCALLLGPPLARGVTIAWLALPLAFLGIFMLARADAAWLVLYAPPVLFNWFAAWVFGHTLLPGEVPLIERFARLLHGPGETLEPAVLSYTRKVTLAWTLLLTALGLVSLALALLAEPGGILLAIGLTPPVRVSRETWSLFANLLNYLLAGAFFVLEYAYRRARFPEQPYRNFFEFLRRAAAASPRVFARQEA